MIIPQPIATIAIAAVGAATIILSAASMSNMYETYSLVQHHRQPLQLSSSALSSSSSASSSSSLSTASSTSAVVSKANTWRTIDEALEGLENMNKKDLVELFLHCDPPAISDLAFSDGDQEMKYDGYLLDNGQILTPVTNFITNRLFGRGNRWLGKAYLNPISSSNKGGIGKNRFLGNHHQKLPTATSNNTPDEFLDRTFDYSIGASILPSASSKSLFQRYASHCPSLSPMSLIWRGMVDELRVLALDNGNDKAKDKDTTIMLGMGYFTWSGGVWNIAPFCLVARQCGSQRHKIE